MLIASTRRANVRAKKNEQFLDAQVQIQTYVAHTSVKQPTSAKVRCPMMRAFILGAALVAARVPLGRRVRSRPRNRRHRKRRARPTRTSKPNSILTVRRQSRRRQPRLLPRRSPRSGGETGEGRVQRKECRGQAGCQGRCSGGASAGYGRPAADDLSANRSTYGADGRRDPFISLLTTNELRPADQRSPPDRRLVRSHGAPLGCDAARYWHERSVPCDDRDRRWVACAFPRIRYNTVVFTIDEFGTTRQDSLILRRHHQSEGKMIHIRTLASAMLVAFGAIGGRSAAVPAIADPQ